MMAAVSLFAKTRSSNRLVFLTNWFRKELISTSSKKSDTSTVTTEAINPSSTKTEPVRKTWVSYGFSVENEDKDRFLMHATFFVGLSLIMVAGGFVWAYRPDYDLRDWAYREAFLELRRREQLGLPLVDPNLIDPANIQLPSDEELGDTDIII